jgi:hypothetical protein
MGGAPFSPGTGGRAPGAGAGGAAAAARARRPSPARRRPPASAERAFLCNAIPSRTHRRRRRPCGCHVGAPGGRADLAAARAAAWWTVCSRACKMSGEPGAGNGPRRPRRRGKGAAQARPAPARQGSTTRAAHARAAPLPRGAPARCLRARVAPQRVRPGSGDTPSTTVQGSHLPGPRPMPPQRRVQHARRGAPAQRAAAGPLARPGVLVRCAGAR